MPSIFTAWDLAFPSWNQRKGLYVSPTHARTQGSSNRKGHKPAKDRLWYIHAMEYCTPVVISELSLNYIGYFILYLEALPFLFERTFYFLTANLTSNKTLSPLVFRDPPRAAGALIGGADQQLTPSSFCNRSCSAGNLLFSCRPTGNVRLGMSLIFAMEHFN